MFLGKKNIFLTECHSTNDELSSRVKSGEGIEGTVVFTDHQKSGKGQRGNTWIDEAGKNVLMSVLIKPNYLLVYEQYLLNVAVGLAVLRCAGRLLGPERVVLKWPNDILVDDKKICGILIENSIKGSRLENSIVGIGFNLNQSEFGLMRATSLLHETGDSHDREDFIENLLVDLEYFLLRLRSGKKDDLLKLYHEKLHLKGILAKYEDDSGVFIGKIVGIDNRGKLVVKKDEGTQHYGIKEIKFLH